MWVRTAHRDDLPAYERAVELSRTRLSHWNPVNAGDLRAHLAAQSRTHRTFVVHAREPHGGHDIVGKVNLTNVARGRFLSAAMGYDAYDPYAGHGLFAQGLRLVVGLALAPEPAGMGLHRLEASVQPGNVVSAGLLRSLGFRREGFSPRMLWLPDASGHEAWRDHDSYALTAEDWPAPAYAAQRAVRAVALVNGPSQVGRSAFARALASELSVPWLSRELLSAGATGGPGGVGAPGGPDGRLWAVLAASPVGAVVEGWFPPSSGAEVEAGLLRAGFAMSDVPEIWCGQDGDDAAGPPSVGPLGFGPLGVGPVDRVDTRAPIEVRDVVRLALAARARTA